MSSIGLQAAHQTSQDVNGHHELHSLLASPQTPELIVDDESYEPRPVVHEAIQTWLGSHVVPIIANSELGVLTVIMTLTEQLFVDVCPKVFILNDFVNVGPSSSVNIGRMVAVQPYVSQPDGESFSGMVDLVSEELSIFPSNDRFRPRI